jgi:hypothetical protein
MSLTVRLPVEQHHHFHVRQQSSSIISMYANRATSSFPFTSAQKHVHWCAGVGMTVCHVVGSWMCLTVCARSSLSGGRPVHCAAWSRYKESGGEGSRVGCQGLALGEARCVL